MGTITPATATSGAPGGALRWRFARRRLGALTRSAGMALALVSLAILTFVVEPHVHRAAGLAAGHVVALQHGSADHQHVRLQGPDDARQPACPVCAAQNVSSVALAFAPSPAAPAPQTVAIAPPADSTLDGLYAGRSWRSRAPPLHA